MVTLGSRTSQEMEVNLAPQISLSDAILMQRFRKAHLLFLFSLLLVATKAQSESVNDLVSKEEKIREEMITISRELGVTCTDCHSVRNFKDDSKKNFKIGKEHMKLTQLLKDNGFDGKKGPASTCFMCHRGKLTPDYKETDHKEAEKLKP